MIIKNRNRNCDLNICYALHFMKKLVDWLGFVHLDAKAKGMRKDIDGGSQASFSRSAIQGVKRLNKVVLFRGGDCGSIQTAPLTLGRELGDDVCQQRGFLYADPSPSPKIALLGSVNEIVIQGSHAVGTWNFTAVRRCKRQND